MRRHQGSSVGLSLYRLPALINRHIDIMFYYYLCMYVSISAGPDMKTRTCKEGFPAVTPTKNTRTCTIDIQITLLGGSKIKLSLRLMSRRH